MRHGWIDRFVLETTSLTLKACKSVSLVPENPTGLRCLELTSWGHHRLGWNEKRPTPDDGAGRSVLGWLDGTLCLHGD